MASALVTNATAFNGLSSTIGITNQMQFFTFNIATKHFSKAQFIDFTAPFVFTVVCLPSMITHGHTPVKTSGRDSVCAPGREMCARSYLRMWVRHTREASSSRSEQEALNSEPDETFNGERKRRLKKGETEATRRLG